MSERGDPLADRWLKRLKSNPVIAVIVVAGTVLAAVVGFSEKAADVYEKHFGVPLFLADFRLSSTSNAYFREESFRCTENAANARTFTSLAKVNRAISLDFVFTNKSKTDAVIRAVDLDVRAAGRTAGGSPGIVVPNHTNIVNLKHEVGIQSFPLDPYRIPGEDTGSFTIVFNPASKGVGLCWTMRAIFDSSLGKVKSEEFSIIMSNF